MSISKYGCFNVICLFIVVSINVANEYTFYFLSEFVLAADKVLIVGDFNIHVYNKKYALGSTFIDMLNSIGVRQDLLIVKIIL